MRRARRAPAALALALAAACAACAGARPTPARIALEGEVVEGAPPDPALARLSAEELWAAGSAADAAGDRARAAAAYGRLADGFPESPRAVEAGARAGLALRALRRFEEALRRFERRAHERVEGEEPGGADDARLLAAEALYELDRRDEARARLDALAARPDLDPARRARALTERGVIELEDGAPDQAERSLEAAVLALEGASGAGPAAAKARFWLGEVARARFQTLAIGPAQGEAALLAQLERKSDLLLAAEERYAAAARCGDPTFGVAAGTRVGELYEGLRDELLAVPTPEGLDPEEERAYRAAVRERLRVLLSKAEEAYGDTLEAARRAGVEGAQVARLEEALGRARRELARE